VNHADEPKLGVAAGAEMELGGARSLTSPSYGQDLDPQVSVPGAYGQRAQGNAHLAVGVHSR
jgi:hypothetical protein